ncbi:MAG: class I SAM-dependent methyltransferase [Lachnospiraceae bacterium]|nr:class I SAM-dependent methyltransferase [Lachnospiraceae bacterium]
MKQEDVNQILNIIESSKDTSIRERKEVYQKKAFDSDSVEVLKQMSFFRGNLYGWYPFKKDGKVLIVGAECGYLTDFFSDKVDKVVVFEEDPVMFDICRKRNEDRENVSFLSREEIFSEEIKESFDYIICDHGLEKFGKELLTLLKILKTKDTIVFLSGANRLGMKYWNGSKSEGQTRVFEGFEQEYGQRQKRLYSRKEYVNLIQASSLCKEVVVYYPYPDEVFPIEVFSDLRLPKVGELNKSLRDFSPEKTELFQESEAFDVVIKEEEFPTFSNGFLFVLQ